MLRSRDVPYRCVPHSYIIWAYIFSINWFRNNITVALFRRWTAHEFFFIFSLFLFFSSLCCLYALKMRNEVKHKTKKGVKERGKESKKQLLCAEKQTSSPSTSIIRVTMERWSMAKVRFAGGEKFCNLIENHQRWHHWRSESNLLSKEICCLQKSETETLKTRAKRISSPRLSAEETLMLKPDGKSRIH